MWPEMPTTALFIESPRTGWFRLPPGRWCHGSGDETVEEHAVGDGRPFAHELAKAGVNHGGGSGQADVVPCQVRQVTGQVPERETDAYLAEQRVRPIGVCREHEVARLAGADVATWPATAPKVCAMSRLSAI